MPRLRGPAILVADPAWQHDDSLGKRGAAAQYKQTMPTREIARMEILTPTELYPRSVCFLWVLGNMLSDGLRVLKAWDYREHSQIVWGKDTVNGNEAFGQGRIVRGAHETCLIGVRGEEGRDYWPEYRSQRSWFRAAVGEHSEKPDDFYAIVERLYPRSRYFEMFARKVRVGWQQHGDELGELG